MIGDLSRLDKVLAESFTAIIEENKRLKRELADVKNELNEGKPMRIPDWDKCYGNNHHKIPKPETIFGGSISFRKHIGGPLTQELWDDLVYRLMINTLCIYKSEDLLWSVGHSPGHCSIVLNDDNTIFDICYTPHRNI